MFSKSAQLYDLVYESAGKDYDAESAYVRSLIRERRPEAVSLLDVACGTGQHILRLRSEFDCAGVDLNPSLLEIARERCPDVSFSEHDMRTIDLNQRFDIVTCLFGSIGYMRSLVEVRQALASMRQHLRPGGLLVIELSNDPGAWRTDVIGMVHTERPDVTAVRMGYSRRNGRIAELELHYLVGTPHGGVTHYVEHHQLGLFNIAEFVAAMDAVGMTAELVPAGPGGRCFLVGTPVLSAGEPGGVVEP